VDDDAVEQITGFGAGGRAKRLSFFQPLRRLLSAEFGQRLLDAEHDAKRQRLEPVMRFERRETLLIQGTFGSFALARMTEPNRDSSSEPYHYNTSIRRSRASVFFNLH
jgi:hypothetical protein